jgi:prepilin-type N-terminal cleavage/methylation domain-containing protein
MKEGSMSRQDHRDEHGFTLVELLIVIAVLGILSGIVLFKVGSSKDDAVASACKTNFKSIELSAEAVYSNTGAYPTVGAGAQDSQAGLDARYANLLEAADNGATLKEYPFSTDYRLVYATSGDSFSVTVQSGAGVTVATNPTRSSGCDAL